MKRHYHIIYISLFMGVLLLLESCTTYQYITEDRVKDYYSNVKYSDDTGLKLKNGIHLYSKYNNISSNKNLVEYNIYLHTYEKNIIDTVVLESYLITDDKGDTLQQAAKCWYKTEWYAIDTLPYTFLINKKDTSSISDILLIDLTAKTFKKHPKTIYISYKFNINGEVVQRENIRYDRKRECVIGFAGFLKILFLPIDFLLFSIGELFG